jgi:hypothetical protein
MSLSATGQQLLAEYEEFRGQVGDKHARQLLSELGLSSVLDAERNETLANRLRHQIAARQGLPKPPATVPLREQFAGRTRRNR